MINWSLSPPQRLLQWRNGEKRGRNVKNWGRAGTTGKGKGASFLLTSQRPPRAPSYPPQVLLSWFSSPQALLVLFRLSQKPLRRRENWLLLNVIVHVTVANRRGKSKDWTRYLLFKNAGQISACQSDSSFGTHCLKQIFNHFLSN